MDTDGAQNFINTGSSVSSRPLKDLMDSGMLWLINRTTFHPRGYALVLETDKFGEVASWKIIGNGKEVWSFQQGNDDEGFAKAEATLEALGREEN